MPDGFHVSAADGMLWYSADPVRFAGQLSEFRVGTAGTYVRDNLRAHGEGAEDQSPLCGGKGRRHGHLRD